MIWIALSFLAGAFLLWRFPKLGDWTFEPAIRWIAGLIDAGMRKIRARF